VPAATHGRNAPLQSLPYVGSAASAEESNPLGIPLQRDPDPVGVDVHSSRRFILLLLWETCWLHFWLLGFRNLAKEMSALEEITARAVQVD